MYICKICGSSNIFKSKRSFIYHIKNYHKLSLEEYFNKYENIYPKKCLYCDKRQKWNDRKFEYFLTCGSKSCNAKYANSKSKESFKNKYGVENPSQLKSVQDKVKQTKKMKYGDKSYNNSKKREQTNLKKYGKKYATQNKDVRNKIKHSLTNIDKKTQIEKFKNTNLKRYGVEHTFQHPEFKNKREQTCLKKYGTTHPFKNKNIYYQKFIKQLKQKYGVTNISQIEEIKQKIKNTYFEKRKNKLKNKFQNLIIDFPDLYSVKIKCPKCKKYSILNISFLEQRDKFGLELCTYCFPYKYSSKIQSELNNYIEKLGFKTIENYKIPNSNKEIDIYIPVKKLGIEVNGIYWHSEIYKNKDYHKNKKKLGLKNNINIINIWEDDYILKENIIKNRLKNILGISNILYARKCEIKALSSKEAKEFLNFYHLHGYVPSTYKFGLFYDNELVSVITFGARNKKHQKNHYELLRYAIKENYKVLGGFNKLINYFIKNYNPTFIYTYIDLDWANGRKNIYENSVFTYSNHTIPDYYWVVNKKRENRQKFMKYKLIKEGNNTNKTENEIMHDKGFYKIYGCGNIKYEWKRK
ncbi:MAG: DUF7487 domain-containing protein [bacterium]